MTAEDGMISQYQNIEQFEAQLEDIVFWYDESIREPREIHDDYNLLARLAIQQMINPATLMSQ